MLSEIIGIYEITDERLKALGHGEDGRVQRSDAAVITRALVAARCFGCHHHALQQSFKDGDVPLKRLYVAMIHFDG